MSRLTLLGAGGANFSPLQISGLKLWLRASDLALNNGDPVASWADQSGVGNNVTQGTTANKPTFVTNQINGLPVVRFDGTDDRLNAANSGYAQTNTIFVVANVGANAGYKDMFSSTTGNENALYLDTAEVFRIFAGTELAGSGDVHGAFKLFCGIFAGSSSKLYINGTQNGSTGNAGTGDSSTFRLGDGPGASTPLPGDIAEVLFYNASLTDAQRQQVEAYLNARYALY